jgi:hypothetical protein
VALYCNQPTPHMMPITDTTRPVRRMQGYGALATPFVVRALKVYASHVRDASIHDLSRSLPQESPKAWKRTASRVYGRLEAASARMTRLDDEFFVSLASDPVYPGLTGRFVSRAVRNYARHVADMPLDRIRHSLRGIDAKKWQDVARTTVDTLDYIAAFDAVAV